MRVAIGLLVVLMIAGCRGGVAASYPSRPLTYLVTFDPGGQSDREARRQQPLLERYLGRPVVIDYKVGGGGALGWSEVAHSRPDGYLFVGFNVPATILQPLLQDTGYETQQLRPVVMFQRTPVGLTVPPNSPFTTLDKFVEAAKARPGTISIGGSSMFSATHLAALRFNKLTGAKASYVPFSGAAPSITAFLGGHTVANFSFSDDLVRYRDRIRILAIATEARFPGFPDVPTFRELGIDLVEAGDRGIAVPRGTPDAVVAKLESAFLRIANDSNIRDAQIREGFVPLAMDAEEARTYVEVRTQHYKELLDELGPGLKPR
jgi:tripartite-type tricarboxylate transporter receptor subunit TctC